MIDYARSLLKTLQLTIEGILVCLLANIFYEPVDRLKLNFWKVVIECTSAIDFGVTMSLVCSHFCSCNLRASFILSSWLSTF